MTPLALLGAVAIGLSLGLTGAGGSILTLPVPRLLAAVFSVIAAAGVLIGGKLVSRLPEVALRRSFALLVLTTAGFVLWRR